MTVQGKTFALNVAWPGGDVETTLTSPSGQVFSRTSHLGAEHGRAGQLSSTTRLITLSLESGQSALMAVMCPQLVNRLLSKYDEPLPNQLPIAVVQISRSSPS